MAEEATLTQEAYYHGLLPREDIKGLVAIPADFILRRSQPQPGAPRQVILSVCTDMADATGGGFVVNHYVIHNANGKFITFIIDRMSFPSIQEMLKHHLTKGESVTSIGNIVLKSPIGRQPWELLHKDIATTKKLGEGAFGEVHLGTWTKKNGDVVKVAIKLAKLESLSKEQIKEIMREVSPSPPPPPLLLPFHARIMRTFDHPHVVGLHGVAAAEEPLMLVMELASHGALDSYLKKNPVADHVKGEMCTQAAWGLEYLHDKNVIHRDIAARNCLYGDGRVKISDFGMSRDGPLYQMDPKKRVPIRWLSPETMRIQVYNFKTDVWSFGIMCWEIQHNGQEPYPSLSAGEAHGLVMSGGRMEWTTPLHPDIKALFHDKLWAENPDDRPSMAECSKSLESLYAITRPEFKASREPSSVPSEGKKVETSASRLRKKDKAKEDNTLRRKDKKAKKK